MNNLLFLSIILKSRKVSSSFSPTVILNFKFGSRLFKKSRNWHNLSMEPAHSVRPSSLCKPKYRISRKVFSEADKTFSSIGKTAKSA